jgi:hypothetical protein
LDDIGGLLLHLRQVSSKEKKGSPYARHQQLDGMGIVARDGRTCWGCDVAIHSMSLEISNKFSLGPKSTENGTAVQLQLSELRAL